MGDALWRLDALCDLCLKGQFVNTPPSSPADGDAYLIGGSPTGAWSGYAYKLASCRDGGWQFLTPFDGLRAWAEDSGGFIVYQDGSWTDWNALISSVEGSIASATTCDIGAAGSLFLEVTGATTITSLGTTPNRLRFLRFAGSLTLTHNATSLILPGGANITTAAGDCALFASDGSGNWRCRQYAKADGRMVNMASPVFTGTLGGEAAAFSGLVAAGSFHTEKQQTSWLTGQTVTFSIVTTEPFTALVALNAGIFANSGEQGLWYVSRVGTTDVQIAAIVGNSGYSVALDGSNRVTITNVSGGNRTMYAALLQLL